ncbi:MAG: 4-(cytidine 5'-diphospho)-2-C-methyl-D-erythritol kinase, partial [Gammaproteobacteria bacterium]|nr:4-(cytidine 5'-diphospho)-2-C-methyl-D-erythritol kinase [Gammaproteobacteria bacterium]
MTASWPAPAKLNLFLRVTGRRPDGYHTLETIFQFIDRCDRLRFEPGDTGEIRLAQSLVGVPDEKNLVVRAARLLRETAGVRHGTTIHIEKNLPMGGGL